MTLASAQKSESFETTWLSANSECFIILFLQAMFTSFRLVQGFMQYYGINIWMTHAKATSLR